MGLSPYSFAKFNEIIDAVINELSINSLQLAKDHGDKPLEFYSEGQMNSTHKTFVDECMGPFLELMNKVCKVSINKATEYGIIRKNLPTSISNILATLFERTNPLIFKYPVHTGIHQYIRNISGSAEVTHVFGKVVAGSWSGNNQIHNLQVYRHEYMYIFVYLRIYFYICIQI
jgi:hypothetical protein